MKLLLILTAFSCSCTPSVPYEPMLFHTRAASGWRCSHEPKIKCPGKGICSGSEQRWVALCPADGRVFKCHLGGRSNSTCLETATSRKNALVRIKKRNSVIPLKENHQTTSIVADERREDLELRKQGKVLLLKSFSYQREYDHIVAIGEVKNISDKPLIGVLAHVSFYSADRKRIKTGKRLLTLDPLIPSQTLPFKVEVSYHPLMRYAAVTFSTPEGKPLPAAK